MSNVSTHKPNDFTPVVGAMNLADYVITITDNPNKFPEYFERKMHNADGTVSTMFIQRQDSLVNTVRNQASRIFILCYTANKINPKKEPERAQERLSKQKEAIGLIEEHLATVQLCRKHFKLAASRVKYWSSLALEVLAAVKGWHEGDKKRYGL